MKVVILAGGSGTRAYPYTDYLPKPISPKALIEKVEKWIKPQPVRQRSAG